MNPRSVRFELRVPPGRSGVTPIATRQTSAFELLRAPSHLHRDLRRLVAVAFGLGHFVLVRSSDALLGERFLEHLAHLGVLDRQEVRHHFDERDLRAEGIEKISELHADRPGADDDHVLRLRLEDHRFRLPMTDLSIERQTRQGRGTQPVAMRIFGAHRVSSSPSPAAHLHFPGAVDRRLAADVVDLVLLEEKLDPAGQPCRRLAASAR